MVTHQLTLPYASETDAFQNLIQGIPEFTALDSSRLSDLNAFVQRRIEYLGRKLRLSPYLPHDTADPLKARASFPQAVHRWLEQFPASYRLGLLMTLLSLIYISEEEERGFLEIAIQRLLTRASEHLSHRPLPVPLTPELLRARLRPYPVSVFGQYDPFLHALRLEGSRDRSLYPYRGLIGETLNHLVDDLRFIAENESNLIYIDEKEEALVQFIRSALSSHFVLLEDCALSGTRVSGVLERISRLFQLLFTEYSAEIKGLDHELPRVYLLVSYGTEDAVRRIAQEVDSQHGERYARIDVLFGHVFSAADSLNGAIPDLVRPLERIIPSSDLLAKIAPALSFFYENHAHCYFTTETRIRVALPAEEQQIFGFKNGGWPIVSHKNAPNNAPPPLWYPHSGAMSTNVHALFTRSESHLDHTDPPRTFDELIQTVEEDKEGRVARMLRRIYRKRINQRHSG